MHSDKHYSITSLSLTSSLLLSLSFILAPFLSHFFSLFLTFSYSLSLFLFHLFLFSNLLSHSLTRSLFFLSITYYAYWDPRIYDPIPFLTISLIYIYIGRSVYKTSIYIYTYIYVYILLLYGTLQYIFFYIG